MDAPTKKWIPFNPHPSKKFHTDNKHSHTQWNTHIHAEKKMKVEHFPSYIEIQFKNFQPFYLSILSNLHRGKIIVLAASKKKRKQTEREKNQFHL